MTDALWSLVIFVLLGTAAAAGRMIVVRLPEMHRTRETMEFTRLVTGLLVTFTALVLSLLIAAVNASYDTTAGDVRSFGADLIRLNASLEEFGPVTLPIRLRLRSYTASALASTWPEEAAPSGTYPRASTDEDEFDADNLGVLLHDIAAAIRGLDGGEALHALIKATCLDRMEAIEAQRWTLIGDAHRTITPQFYDVMLVWLVVIFLSFGLSAPRNPFATTAMALVALCVAAAFFVMLELDGPLDGLVKVSSEPMRHALRHLDRSIGGAAG